MGSLIAQREFFTRLINIWWIVTTRDVIIILTILLIRIVSAEFRARISESLRDVFSS